MAKQSTNRVTYDDLAFTMRLISRRTPATLIRKDLLPELCRRGMLDQKADRAFVISELGKLICRRINDGERVQELE